ncbi:MAG: mRNA surveillance protein pelota [Promethearchaeota archaeon]|nr:MAG: mRNA surveillance protein pelota [Candidatus Lokiarchaeota archaeon]
MKILEENLNQGEITVQVENLNDLWTLFNVIAKDDEVSGLTLRRVVMKEGSKGERKLMRLKLKVEDIAFHEFSNRLRIKGTILEGPDDFVSYGSYHTINLEINHQITIIKETWHKNELKRLKQASKFESNFVMLMIAMETGLATLSLITNFSQSKIATIKKHIPGKRYQQSHRNKALVDFFKQVQKVMEENLKNKEVDLIIICGPGNTREVFINYLKDNATDDYLSKIRSFHASTGTESAIRETLKSQEIASIKQNVKIFQETKKIEEIFEYFSKEPDLIAIGCEEVYKAAEIGAIKEVFIVDKLIRGASTTNKLKIEEIITNVENSRGEINILSSQHPTGEQIIDLGSIVGILRYKVY